MKTLVVLGKLLTRRQTLARWLHELTAPDADLTLLEIVAVWCAMQLRKQTVRQWAEELGPKLRSPLDPAEAADTAPLTMLEAALLMAIGANDNAVRAGGSLQQIYEHTNIAAIHKAMTDPTYPRDAAQVAEAAAFVRGETDHPAYAVKAVLDTMNTARQAQALASGNGAAK